VIRYRCYSGNGGYHGTRRDQEEADEKCGNNKEVSQEAIKKKETTQ